MTHRVLLGLLFAISIRASAFAADAQRCDFRRQHGRAVRDEEQFLRARLARAVHCMVAGKNSCEARQRAARGDDGFVRDGDAPQAMQLFDLQPDPGEQHDVAAEHADVIERLKKAYDEPNRQPHQDPLQSTFQAKPPTNQ